MKRMIGDELIASAGDKVFTERDAIECALSLALQDAGISISDPRWERLCKNATSEVIRQMRKVTTMSKPELTGSYSDQQVQIGVMLLESQERTNTLLQQLIDGTSKKGKSNGSGN